MAVNFASHTSKSLQSNSMINFMAKAESASPSVISEEKQYLMVKKYPLHQEKLINECFQFHCVEFVQMACNCQTELKSGVIEKKVKQSSHMSNLGQCHGVPAFLFYSWRRQRKRKEKYYSDRMDEFNISMQSYFCMERINELGKCNILIFSPNHHTSKYLDQGEETYLMQHEKYAFHRNGITTIHRAQCE